MASLIGGADNDGIGKQFSSPSNVKNVDTDGARKRGRHASNAKDSDYENSKPNTPPHERESAASQQLFTSDDLLIDDTLPLKIFPEKAELDISALRPCFKIPT